MNIFLKPGSAFVFSLCVFYLGACSLLVPKTEEPLRIPPAVLGERTVEQQLLIRWPTGERSMDAVLEIEGGRLRLVLMAFGMRISSLDYDGETLAQERFVPHAPDGVRILNDLLMVAAPEDALKNALPAGWTLKERIDKEGAGKRDIFADGGKRIEIHYSGGFPGNPWRGRVALKNHAGGYELVVISHEI
jgi:hypothetical protein